MLTTRRGAPTTRVLTTVAPQRRSALTAVRLDGAKSSPRTPTFWVKSGLREIAATIEISPGNLHVSWTVRANSADHDVAELLQGELGARSFGESLVGSMGSSQSAAEACSSGPLPGWEGSGSIETVDGVATVRYARVAQSAALGCTAACRGAALTRRRHVLRGFALRGPRRPLHRTAPGGRPRRCGHHRGAGLPAPRRNRAFSYLDGVRNIPRGVRSRHVFVNPDREVDEPAWAVGG